jgi:phosphoribosylanthranilate isomerase
VDRLPEEVARIMDFCQLNYAQLHGAESPQDVSALTGMGHRAIKAFRVRDAASLTGIGEYRAAAYLLDTYVPGAAGGTGRRFDWTLALKAKSHGPIILAGGLNADNVGEAVRMVRSWGVDVSSGVEAEPGRKDPDKVRRFVTEAKNACEVKG